MLGQLFRKIDLMSLLVISLSIYCTCTAITCNHVPDMLFRIENAVQTGLTTSTKTSVLCTWNIPKGQRVSTTVKQVRDFAFEKYVFTKPKSK